ncbi:hypothetical protein WJX77_005886 [Trebouxia sp. C0004]
MMARHQVVQLGPRQGWAGAHLLQGLGQVLRLPLVAFVGVVIRGMVGGMAGVLARVVVMMVVVTLALALVQGPTLPWERAVGAMLGVEKMGLERRVEVTEVERGGEVMGVVVGVVMGAVVGVNVEVVEDGEAEVENEQQQQQEVDLVRVVEGMGVVREMGVMGMVKAVGAMGEVMAVGVG